jgi:hypothetical protein
MIATRRRNRLSSAISPRVAALGALLYCAVHAAITLASGPALALDDVKLNVLTQSWQAGYLPDNPPLFEWTLILAQGVFGPSLASFVAVKYFFLLMAAAFAFLALREATGDERAGAAAALLLPLIPQVGWAYHQTLTHSAALLAATAFFWFALLRLERRHGFADFALLGLSIGAGAVSKYAFLPAALIGLASACAMPAMRRALLQPRLALTVIVAAAVMSPHLFWLASVQESAAALTEKRLIGEGGYWARLGAGLPAALWAIAAFFAPLLMLLFAFERRLLRAMFARRRDLLFVAASVAAIGILVAVILVGIANFQERYALAFLFPGYLWLVAAAWKAKEGSDPFAVLIVAAAAVAAISGAVRAAEVVRPGPPFCRECRQHIPYAHLKTALSGEVRAGDTLVAFDDTTAGNLRRLFPEARVLSAHQPLYAPPVGDSRACRFIWSTDIAPAPAPSALDQLDKSQFVRAGGSWSQRMSGEEKYRSTWWTIAPLDPSTPIGAALCRI